ncbi:uncharacterized protein METZ01_LOCUS204049, partial [marine metagenome]
VKSFNISYQLINSFHANACFPDDFGLASYHLNVNVVNIFAKSQEKIIITLNYVYILPMKLYNVFSELINLCL